MCLEILALAGLGALIGLGVGGPITRLEAWPYTGPWPRGDTLLTSAWALVAVISGALTGTVFPVLWQAWLVLVARRSGTDSEGQQ